MNRIYTPDKWVIVEITGGPDPSVYKILAGWYGGFAAANTWKLSSGIVNADPKPHLVEYPQYTGSVYICHDAHHGLTSLTGGLLSSWQKQLETTGHTMSVMPFGFDVKSKL